jgi:hypothetical protein
MHHITTSGRRPAVAALLILLLACIGLAACGGSSSSSSSSTAASATSTSPGTGPGAKGPGSSRFAALRECLQKNGITLPKRPTGGGRPQRRGGAGGFLGAGGAGASPTLPKGVTRAQYEAAVKKCGGGNFAGGGARRFNSPVFKAALSKFANCLRENGVKVPAPNTSGKGPIFDTKGLNTRSTQFKAAETKCSSVLRGAFRGGAGRPGAAGPGGGPPAGGQQQPPQ